MQNPWRFGSCPIDYSEFSRPLITCKVKIDKTSIAQKIKGFSAPAVDEKAKKKADTSNIMKRMAQIKNLSFLTWNFLESKCSPQEQDSLCDRLAFFLLGAIRYPMPYRRLPSNIERRKTNGNEKTSSVSIKCYLTYKCYIEHNHLINVKEKKIRALSFGGFSSFFNHAYRLLKKRVFASSRAHFSFLQ